MHERARLGRSGEQAAADLYRRSGFEVELNYRAGRNEVDLIAYRPGLVVFCEVKTRLTDRWGIPAEAVGYQKQARIRRAAATWLAERHPGRVDVRFDVVSVIVTGGRMQLSHIPGAF